MITATMAFGWSGFGTSLEVNIRIKGSFRLTVIKPSRLPNSKIKGLFPLSPTPQENNLHQNKSDQMRKSKFALHTCPIFFYRKQLSYMITLTIQSFQQSFKKISDLKFRAVLNTQLFPWRQRVTRRTLIFWSVLCTKTFFVAAVERVLCLFPLLLLCSIIQRTLL